MDRIDAYRFRFTRDFASGTRFAYRYTRGSWQSADVGENGLEAPVHLFVVREVDALRRSDIVYHWSDQNPAAPQAGPESIPTPFNPAPFRNLPAPP